MLYVFSRSLREGYIPPSQKRALVSPSLKKPNLDPTNCQNFRPISNLSSISKTLERLVSLQLLLYLENSGLLPAYQSGFRTNHSTETALLSLLSEMYSAIVKCQLSLLAFFDVSAAFDMVDHQILLQRLETSCGISSLPRLWIKSDLSDRTQMIVSGESRTSRVPNLVGCPPRVLCWALFSSSYILLTSALSFQNIQLLVTFLLTTFRHMFMVLPLVNFFSPAKLNYSQMILSTEALLVRLAPRKETSFKK